MRSGRNLNELGRLVPARFSPRATPEPRPAARRSRLPGIYGPARHSLPLRSAPRARTQRGSGAPGRWVGRRGLALGRQLRGGDNRARRRGRRPGPPRPEAAEAKQKRNAEATECSIARAALDGPCPPPSCWRSRDAPLTAARWRPPPPTLPQTHPPRRANESPPPTAGPPSLARLPGLLGNGPLHPSRLLTALRRIPPGGCAAILSDLQSQDRPPQQSDCKAAGATVGPAAPHPLPGRSAQLTRPPPSASRQSRIGNVVKRQRVRPETC
ncbi:uncharacterized protein PS065_010171 isoform 2-T2 [Dugong dugon]